MLFTYMVGAQVHWDNGFLAYWDAKQLPNFLLAVPCVLMILHHSWEFTQVSELKLGVQGYGENDCP